jgi:hypothetical protein
LANSRQDDYGVPDEGGESLTDEEPRPTRDPGVPVKIEKPTQEAVKKLAVLYDESQQKFYSRLLAYFVENNGAEIEAKAKDFVDRTSTMVSEIPRRRAE